VPLAIHVPAAYEANPGYLVGTAPAGTTALTVLVDGRRYRTIARRARGKRFRIGPIGLPTRDLTLTVRAERKGRVLARASVRHVHGLPRTGFLARPARATDPGAQAALRRLGGGSRSAWLRHLGTRRAASWNAGATFPAASTLKLAILLASMARSSGDPVRGGPWSTYRRLVFDSSNRAANELLVRMGGSTSSGGHIVNGFVAGLGARSTDMYGGYLLEPGERRLAETPPAAVESQPGYPTGKHTSAHDLGAMLTALVQAAAGRGPAPRLGLTAREARCALWLLLHARYAGLFAPASPFAVAHKAGWLPNVQHDAAVVFTPRGPLVAVTMNYGSGGVSVGASQAYAARLLQVAAREL
jgi:Beta-lactamase enzyme family